ncbi:MAG: MgtC/SapB family protein [Pseudomonas sp.]|nr:MgtC/SapB family protein [Pseudomonas sp.]MDX1369894.1 MgtC/SapB family protein [Pseudomonas sp.]
MELIERVIATLSAEFSDFSQLEAITRTSMRLVLAAVLGGLLGFEREVKGKAAGVRTHMLVTLGTALFVIAIEQDGASDEAVSRVIQGIAAGIGFICAGTILKGRDMADVQGLTTAGGLWLATAIGVTVGLGRGATAIVATVLALLILHVLPLLLERQNAQPPGSDEGPR